MISAPRPQHQAVSGVSLRSALFVSASGLLPFVIAVTLRLLTWYERRRVAPPRIDPDPLALLTVFGVALGFELLLVLLVFHPHRLGRVVLLTGAAAYVPFLAAVTVLDSYELLDLGLEGTRPLAIWTAVSALLTIAISARLLGNRPSVPR